MINTVSKQSGVAFELKNGQFLKIIDIEGQQVSDMVLFNQLDIGEKISSGKTFDFEETIKLTKGNFLWSNRSNKMAEIVEDTNGCNDFLLAPCSQKTFEIMYGIKEEHPNCLNNLSENLKKYRISKDEIPNAFNIFMNVEFNLKGKLKVKPPKSKEGDYLIIRAMMEMIVGLTACSAEDSNGGSFKGIQYEIKDTLII